MRTLKVKLENCYGIKKLDAEFDFSRDHAVAIYAPNGSMKSSLAQTFKDVSEGAVSTDRIFPARVSARAIVDENDVALPPETIVVVQPYDEVFGQNTKTSTLLVNAELRVEYEKLHQDIGIAKEAFLKAMKEATGSKRNLEKEISTTFTKSDSELYVALRRIMQEVSELKDTTLSDTKYDLLFDEKCQAFLKTKDFKDSIKEYIEQYNQLLAASSYFKKGIFNYYNAATIAKSLSDNGFFAARHTVHFNSDKVTEVSSEEELANLVQAERDSITNDAKLKAKFADIEKQITKNVDLRNFHAYLLENDFLLPHLANPDKLKEDVWKAHIKHHFELYADLLQKHQDAEKRKQEIEGIAAGQRTQWEAVIDIFNSRFFVPFKLTPKNRTAVILGQEPLLSLGFTFEEGAESVSVEKNELMQVLSTGEKKALYVLNIIFEVEVRKQANLLTLFVVDDIADSFDYKNKYAIIEYLRDISEESNFRQLILTHNFDFLRTTCSRFVGYPNCFMVLKTSEGLTLEKAAGINNIFIKDWKLNFYTDVRKKIACIPFVRNIVEYTKGDQDPHFTTLTSLLHWKQDSAAITVGELDDIFGDVFGNSQVSPNRNESMIDVINRSATDCLGAAQGVNFEHKIVLSVAIRVAAERFMITRINDAAFVAGITSNQTAKLYKRFKSDFAADLAQVDVLRRVMLMTPESIHLNSFMYEPILDMSDDHLKRLYGDVLALA